MLAASRLSAPRRRALALLLAGLVLISGSAWAWDAHPDAMFGHTDEVMAAAAASALADGAAHDHGDHGDHGCHALAHLTGLPATAQVIAPPDGSLCPEPHADRVAAHDWPPLLKPPRT